MQLSGEVQCRFFFVLLSELELTTCDLLMERDVGVGKFCNLQTFKLDCASSQVCKSSQGCMQSSTTER